MKYGLIGEKLTHSLSPEIHRLLGNDGYCLLELKPDDLGAFMKTRDFSGINVTIPYKQAVTEYLDEIDVYAEKTRAVNTVVNRGGRLYGYNTDVYGILATLTADFSSLSGIDVFILGSGGTSRSAAYAAELLGADSIYRVSREKKGEGIVSYGQAAVMMRKKRHILINTTPVGTYPDNEDC